MEITVLSESRQLNNNLSKSHQFLQSSIDTLHSHIAILDENGLILLVNLAWRKFADANGLAWGDYGVGRNYLEVCETAVGDGVNEARPAFEGIHGIISNQLKESSLEYPCHSPNERRWFLMYASRLQGNGHIVVDHMNITYRKLSKEKFQWRRH